MHGTNRLVTTARHSPRCSPSQSILVGCEQQRILFSPRQQDIASTLLVIFIVHSNAHVSFSSAPMDFQRSSSSLNSAVDEISGQNSDCKLVLSLSAVPVLVNTVAAGTACAILTAADGQHSLVLYPHMPIGKVLIYRLLFLCVLVCLFVRSRILSTVHRRPRQRSHIFVNSAPVEAQNRTNRPARGPRPPGCKHYRGDAPT